MELMVPSLFLCGTLSHSTLSTFFFFQVFCFKCFSRVSLLLTYVLLWCFSITLIHTRAHTAPSKSLHIYSDLPVYEVMVSPVQCLRFKQSRQLQLSN